MTPKFSLITALAAAALVVAVPAALADSWGADARHASVAYAPDVVERTVAAEQAKLSAPIKLRRDGGSVTTVTSPLDARERSFAAKREAQLTGAISPDVFERAVAARGRDVLNPVVDDRFRIEPTNVPVHVSAPSSGREIKWPQIGIGFGLGILLALGLFLGMRAIHARPLAH